MVTRPVMLPSTQDGEVMAVDRATATSEISVANLRCLSAATFKHDPPLIVTTLCYHFFWKIKLREELDIKPRLNK